MAHIRFQDAENLFAKADTLVNESILPNAKAADLDHFRSILYKPVVQAAIMKHHKKARDAPQPFGPA